MISTNSGTATDVLDTPSMSCANVGCIPHELRDLAQWVLWRNVTRSGTPTKMPITANGSPASSTDPATWASCDEVCRAFNASRHAGIGFVFTDSDPYVGIDLDGCRDPETGTVTDWALDEVKRFDSYTEISPSETGLKIWITADTKLPKGRNKKLLVPEIVAKKPGVEVYSQGRYFAVTGNVFRAYTEIKHRESELLGFLARHWPEAPAVDLPQQDWRSDDAVMERAGKYLARIPPAVSDSGGHNATFHAACVLVKGFALSPDQAFNVMQPWNSTCQPPWSEPELQHKLDDAAKASGVTGYLRNAKPERWDSIRVPASEAGAVPDANDWTNIRADKGRTDVANSRRFLAQHRDKVRFCHEWNAWLIWDGKRWRIDKDGAVMRLAKAVADRVWTDAGVFHDRDEVNFAIATSGAPKLAAMLKLAAADVSIAVDELDANPWLLNCENGTVDLRTGELRPHRREDNLTKLCPTNYNPAAGSQHWDRFLRGIFEDAQTVDFLQRFTGYCLTGAVSEQILAVLWGVGSNGKSTFLTAFQDVLGPDYSMAAPPGLLTVKKSDSHPTEVADLFGQRFVVSQETEDGNRLAESLVKSLTGGDKVRARRMRENFWQFSPTHKLVLCTNHRPKVRGTDHAIWRRLVLIPFLKTYWNPDKGETGPDELRQDKALPAKLKAESEGVLAWAVRGCLDWQRGGLRIPDSVRAATAEYRSEEDVLGRFACECCLTRPDHKVKFSDLYEALEAYCGESGDKPPTKKALGVYLKDHGFASRQSGSRWYDGLKLKEST